MATAGESRNENYCCGTCYTYYSRIEDAVNCRCEDTTDTNVTMQVCNDSTQGTQLGTATVVVSSQSLLADEHVRTYQSIQNRAVNVVFKLQTPPAGQNNNATQGMQNGMPGGHATTTTASGSSLITSSPNIPITVTPDFPIGDGCSSNSWNGATAATGSCSMSSVTSDLDSSKQASNFAWNSRSVKLLITLFGEHKLDFYDSNKKKKGVWAQISQQMREKGYAVTADACDTKWRNMLKTYRKTSEHNKQAGKKVRKSPFYEEMMEALRNTPGAESSGVLDTNRLQGSNTGKNRADETEGEQQRPKKKRTNELISWLDTKKKEQQKQEREKMQILMQMHKEKMELMSALIQVLKEKKENQ